MFSYLSHSLTISRIVLVIFRNTIKRYFASNVEREEEGEWGVAFGETKNILRRYMAPYKPLLQSLTYN